MTGTINNDVFLLKVNHNLNLNFIKIYPFPEGEQFKPNSLIETKSGYFIVGEKLHLNSYYGENYIIKTDEKGNEIWKKKYVVNGNKSIAKKIKAIDENTFVISGAIFNFDSWEVQSEFRFSYLYAIDSTGTVKWDWQGEGLYGNGINDFQILEDGSWICASEISDYDTETDYITVPYVFKMDKDFNFIWSKALDDYYYWDKFLLNIEQTIDGNYITSGNTISSGIHYKFTPEGDSLWLRSDRIYIVGGQRTIISGTKVANDGNIYTSGHCIINGTTTYTGPYGFLIKITNDGCIDIDECPDWTNIEDINIQNLSISAYPNPASDWVTFSKVNEILQKEVDIVIYDVMGHRVRDTSIDVFEKDVKYNISPLKNGVYFYQIVLAGVVIGMERIVVSF